MTTKRENILSWDEYFMSLALLSSQRSKDPNTQVGAVIVNDKKRIIGIGYNGFPHGCSDDDLPWGKTGEWENTKYPFVCHAEMNAILNKNQSDCSGSTIYTTLFPCNECTKLIIQSSISRVVYAQKKSGSNPVFSTAEKLLDLAKIETVQFITKNPNKIKIDLTNRSISLLSDKDEENDANVANVSYNLNNIRFQE